MEEDNTGLLRLPRREYGLGVNFPNSASKKFIVNYYDVRVGKDSTMYQFSFETQPVIPNDSKELLYQAIRNVKKQLKQKVGYVSSSGNMLWGNKNLTIPLNLKSEFKLNDTVHKFNILIKPTITMDLATLLKTPEGTRTALQFYNNKIKEMLRNKKMDEISKGKYFDKKKVEVKSVGLSILRGFKFTLCPLKRGLTLQIDVCSRVFRSANLLQEMNNMEQIKNLVGSTVITRYGKIRTYSILKVDLDLNPKSQFFHEKRAEKISFAKYFEESYGIKVSSFKQPLIEVVLRTDKRLINGRIEKTDVKGYLIPEFVSLTGMSKEQKKNFATMKEIAPFTKFTPDERMKNTQNLINTLKGDDLRIGEPLKMQGYLLNEPEVKLFSQVFKSKDGTLRFKDKVKNAIDLKDWVLVYSQGQNSKNDDDADADSFVHLLEKASQTYGIKVSKPGFITCDYNYASMKAQIKKDIDKNGKPQIIVLLLNPSEEKYYGNLKKWFITELNIHSQIIRKRTVSSKAKNPLSAASMILIQINQKIGGITWEVIRRSPYLDKKKIMYGAFSISKGQKGFTLAFVGTLNSESTKVFSYCKTNYKRKEDIPKADFDAIFYKWAKFYVMENKEGPGVILIYREGLSVQQIQTQIKSEIDALNEVVIKIGQKTKCSDYKPEIIYITVNKKINTRIFEASDSKNSQGKFPPQVSNPPSGSCIFDELSVDKLYDFHLTAQKVTQGTCTPTHYIMVYNKSNIPQQSLAQFTYEQCFNYYNWQGAVKVPACLQCADKLAKLVGESIQANIIQGQIQKGFFFL